MILFVQKCRNISPYVPPYVPPYVALRSVDWTLTHHPIATRCYNVTCNSNVKSDVASQRLDQIFVGRPNVPLRRIVDAFRAPPSPRSANRVTCDARNIAGRLFLKE